MRPFLRILFRHPKGAAPSHSGRHASPIGHGSPPRGPTGFTLVELLFVTVLISLIAAIAVHKVTKIKDVATLAVLRSDLKAVTLAQEVYHAETGGFFTQTDPNGGKGPAFTKSKKKLGVEPSPNIRLQIRGNKKGWTARAQHKEKGGLRCAVSHGDVKPFKPAEQEGVIACQTPK